MLMLAAAGIDACHCAFSSRPGSNDPTPSPPSPPPSLSSAIPSAAGTLPEAGFSSPRPNVSSQVFKHGDIYPKKKQVINMKNSFHLEDNPGPSG
jgi:hypothetical protein